MGSLRQIILTALAATAINAHGDIDQLKSQASGGDAQAQYELGVCYENGTGVAKDYSEAAEWYRKAAAQGECAAQSGLGALYYEGLGVEQSYTEAAKLFRAAAEQGDIEGQRNLGICYEGGRGVERNLALAMYWYKKAAEAGDQDAHQYYNNLYIEGYRAADTATPARKNKNGGAKIRR